MSAPDMNDQQYHTTRRTSNAIPVDDEYDALRFDSGDYNRAAESQLPGKLGRPNAYDLSRIHIPPSSGVHESMTSYRSPRKRYLEEAERRREESKATTNAHAQLIGENGLPTSNIPIRGPAQQRVPAVGKRPLRPAVRGASDSIAPTAGYTRASAQGNVPLHALVAQFEGNTPPTETRRKDSTVRSTSSPLATRTMQQDSAMANGSSLNASRLNGGGARLRRQPRNGPNESASGSGVDQGYLYAHESGISLQEESEDDSRTSLAQPAGLARSQQPAANQSYAYSRPSTSGTSDDNNYQSTSVPRDSNMPGQRRSMHSRYSSAVSSHSHVRGLSAELPLQTQTTGLPANVGAFSSDPLFSQGEEMHFFLDASSRPGSSRPYSRDQGSHASSVEGFPRSRQHSLFDLNHGPLRSDGSMASSELPRLTSRRSRVLAEMSERSSASEQSLAAMRMGGNSYRDKDKEEDEDVFVDAPLNAYRPKTGDFSHRMSIADTFMTARRPRYTLRNSISAGALDQDDEDNRNTPVQHDYVSTSLPRHSIAIGQTSPSRYPRRPVPTTSYASRASHISPLGAERDSGIDLDKTPTRSQTLPDKEVEKAPLSGRSAKVTSLKESDLAERRNAITRGFTVSLSEKKAEAARLRLSLAIAQRQLDQSVADAAAVAGTDDVSAPSDLLNGEEASERLAGTSHRAEYVATSHQSTSANTGLGHTASAGDEDVLASESSTQAGQSLRLRKSRDLADVPGRATAQQHTDRSRDVQTLESPPDSGTSIFNEPPALPSTFSLSPEHAPDLHARTSPGLSGADAASEARESSLPRRDLSSHFNDEMHPWDFYKGDGERRTFYKFDNGDVSPSQERLVKSQSIAPLLRHDVSDASTNIGRSPVEVKSDSHLRLRREKDSQQDSTSPVNQSDAVGRNRSVFAARPDASTDDDFDRSPGYIATGMNETQKGEDNDNNNLSGIALRSPASSYLPSSSQSTGQPRDSASSSHRRTANFTGVPPVPSKSPVIPRSQHSSYASPTALGRLLKSQPESPLNSGLDKYGFSDDAQTSSPQQRQTGIARAGGWNSSKMSHILEQNQGKSAGFEPRSPQLSAGAFSQPSHLSGESLTAPVANEIVEEEVRVPHWEPARSGSSASSSSNKKTVHARRTDHVSVWAADKEKSMASQPRISVPEPESAGAASNASASVPMTPPKISVGIKRRPMDYNSKMLDLDLDDSTPGEQRANLENIADFALHSPSLAWYDNANAAHPDPGYPMHEYPDAEEYYRSPPREYTPSRKGKERAPIDESYDADNENFSGHRSANHLEPPRTNYSRTTSADGQLLDIPARKTSRPPTSTDAQLTSEKLRSRYHHSRQAAVDKTAAQTQILPEQSTPKPTAPPPHFSNTVVVNGAPADGVPALDPAQAAELKRLKTRRHVIQELVSTEAGFNQDMIVVVEIYQATAVSILRGEDSVASVFGNSVEIKDLSGELSVQLRQNNGQVYIKPAGRTWTSLSGEPQNVEEDDSKEIGVAKLPSVKQVDNNKEIETEDPSLKWTLDEFIKRDRTTRVGQLFVEYMERIEKVYTEYVKQQALNTAKLSVMQTEVSVQTWLQQCHEHASDLTHAWDLPSLLVKPFQRVLKYPLLLKSLKDVTPETHPDYLDLAEALDMITVVTSNINEAKRRADVIDKIMAIEVQPTSGFTNPFLTKEKKLAFMDAFNDPAYDEAVEQFSTHLSQIDVIKRDVVMYIFTVMEHVKSTHNMSMAVLNFVESAGGVSEDVISRWHIFAQSSKEYQKTTGSVYTGNITATVTEPMNKLLKIYQGPKILMEKRSAVIAGYVRFASEMRAKKTIAEKLAEIQGQVKDISDTIIRDLTKLFIKTKELMRECLSNLVNCQIKWLANHKHRLFQDLAAAGIDSLPQSAAAIVERFLLEHGLIEREPERLGITDPRNRANNADEASLASTAVDSTSRHGSLGRLTSQDYTTRRLRKRGDSSEVNTHHVPKLSHDASRTDLSLAIPRERGHGSMSADARAQNYSFDSLHRPSMDGSSGEVSSHRNSASGTSYNASNHTLALPPPPSHPPPPQPALPRKPVQRTSAPTHTTAPTPTSIYSQPPPTVPARGPSLFTSALPPQDDTYVDNIDYDESYVPEDMHFNPSQHQLLWLASSLYTFSLDEDRLEAGYPYLHYQASELFDVYGEKGELWLARSQEGTDKRVGWIWNKHFMKIPVL